MEPLPVAVPWNLSSYVTANGFHPLYRALFEDNSRISFNALDEVSLARRLGQDEQVYRDLVAKQEHCMAALPGFLRETAFGRRFIEHLSPGNLALAAELPGALELHHTSPFTAGARPFVLHCESFLPIFQPFWAQGMECLHNVPEVRALYRQLLGGETCLGILSHIPATLDQISRFFRDPAIDAKLHGTGVGLCQAHLDALSSRPHAPRGTPPVFLFTSSAHQSARTFGLRGGFAALLFAERFLRSGRDGRFLFRAKRPPRVDAHAAGVNVDFLASVGERKLFWLEHYLPEHEQLRLFAAADFLLLPSLNLHSVALMQALAAGAVPVVSDTHGPENYVTDGDTGIVLRGVRSAAWREDPRTGIPVIRYDVPAGLNSELAGQALHRITQLLEAPGAIEAMRERMRNAAQRRHSGRAFRDEVTELVLRLWREAPSSLRRSMRPPSVLSREGLLRNGRWARLFESPPHPVLKLNSGGAKVYSCKGVYYMVRQDLSPAFEDLAPLALKERGWLDPWKVELADQIEDLLEALFRTYGKSGLLAARWRYGQFRLLESVKDFLSPYKRLYRLARWIYRAAGGVRRRVARLGS